MNSVAISEIENHLFGALHMQIQQPNDNSTDLSECRQILYHEHVWDGASDHT